MARRILREAKPSVPHHQVGLRRSHGHLSGLRAHHVSIPGVGHADPGLAIEPLGECGAKRFTDVQNEQDRQREWRRQGAKDLEDRAQVLQLKRRSPRPRSRVAGATAPAAPWAGLDPRLPKSAQPCAEMRHHANARHELDGGDELSFPRAVRFGSPRLLQHVDGPGGQGLVGLEQLAPVRRRRDDENRRRTVRHDVLGRAKAAHDRQHHVHRHHIGPKRVAALDGLLPIPGFTHDLQRRIGGEHVAQTSPHGQRVFDDEDANRRHHPTSVRMRSSSTP